MGEILAPMTSELPLTSAGPGSHLIRLWKAGGFKRVYGVLSLVSILIIHRSLQEGLVSYIQSKRSLVISMTAMAISWTNLTDLS